MNRPGKFEVMKMAAEDYKKKVAEGSISPSGDVWIPDYNCSAGGIELEVNNIDGLRQDLKCGLATKRDVLQKLHRILCRSARELMVNKNADYGLEDNPMANFQVSESLLGIKPAKGILIRMADKLSRIGSFLQKGEFKVSDEGLDDTIKDIINYAVLLRAQLLFEEMEA